MCICKAFVFSGVFFVGNRAIQHIAIQHKSVENYEIAWEMGPVVGSSGEAHCFHGKSTFDASIETLEGAHHACSLDQKCNFIWSHKCSGRWWKCYGEAPMVDSGDRSSCTEIKVAVRRGENRNWKEASSSSGGAENQPQDGKQSALLSTEQLGSVAMGARLNIVNAAHVESRDGNGQHPSVRDYAGVNVIFTEGAKLRNSVDVAHGSRVIRGHAKAGDAAHEVRSSALDLTRGGTRFFVSAPQRETVAGADSSAGKQSVVQHESVATQQGQGVDQHESVATQQGQGVDQHKSVAIQQGDVQHDSVARREDVIRHESINDQDVSVHHDSLVRSTLGIAWEWGPTVGSNGKLNCFHGSNTFDASIETQEEAQHACSLDRKCNFIWSHRCSGRWWKCYGEAPMAQSGDRSSCTSIKVAMRRMPAHTDTGK